MVAVMPPTASVRKAERTVPCSAWARKRSRCTTSRVSTPAQTNKVMTSAAWMMCRTREATSSPTATSHERRWPLSTPRASMIMPMPEIATSAPAAWVTSMGT